MKQRVRSSPLLLGLLVLTGCFPLSTDSLQSEPEQTDNRSAVIADCNTLVPVVKRAASNISVLTDILSSRSEARFQTFSAEQYKVGVELENLSIGDPTLRDGVRQMAKGLKAFRDGDGLDFNSIDSVEQFQEVVGVALDQYRFGLGKLRACNTG